MHRTMPRLWAVLVCVVALFTLAIGSQRAQAQEYSHTFFQTNHTVRGMFLSYWEEHGGVMQQGYPISEEIQEKSDADGKTYSVQYFERAVFELHPEIKPPNNVLLSLLGVFQYERKYKEEGAPKQVASSDNAILFPETGKTLGGSFRQYWETHGGLAQQGYPISNEFTEHSDLDGNDYKVQYFQRAVFELHPENKGTPFEVLLSQLGTSQYRDKYLIFQIKSTATPTAARATNTSIATAIATATLVATAASPAFTVVPTVNPTPAPGAGTNQIDPALIWWTLGLLALVVGTAVLFAVGREVTRTAPYTPALVALAPFALMSAAATTVISYILQLVPLPAIIPGAGGSAVLIGLVVGTILWLIAGIVYCSMRLSAVDGANPRSYSLLCSRLEGVATRLDNAVPQGVVPDATRARVASYNEALAQLAFVKSMVYRDHAPAGNPQHHIYGRGMQWVSGYGYVDLWNRLHRAEEALIELEPIEELVGYAALDRMRLQGSSIAHSDDLLRMLRYSTDTLYILREAVGDAPPTPPAPPAAGGGAVPQAVPPAPLPAAVTPLDRAQARATMRQVRRTINEFRDSSWEGLIQARNHLIETVVFTGLAAYLLLVFTVIAGASPDAIGAATTFFLVGSAVGLFNRQRLGSGASTHIDDYGLWHARLVHTPVFSGLAALAGVVLFAVVPVLLNAEAITPQQSPTPTATTVAQVAATNTRASIVTATPTSIAPAGGNSASALTFTATPAQAATATPTATPVPPTATATATATASPTPQPGAAAAPKRIPRLEDIFSIERNLFGLIIAATFGLAPTLVVSALQKQIDKYNVDIKSTEPQVGDSDKS